jgi:hypothetical protein
MSWKRAPLYTACHDLCRYLEAQSDRVARPQSVANATALRARDLLAAASCALTFPVWRAEHLRRVDESIVALRVLLRLQADVGEASPGFTRMIAAQLDAIGRMVGGWTKAQQARRRARGGQSEQGEGP